ncbi:6677_t:CDS:10 [Entrophospora sp. SA101]|nr:6677_t:CDS:10 [Entrophospora sp. SA101]
MVAEAIDYRVSRIVILCKDCGQDAGLYPARHKCGQLDPHTLQGFDIQNSNDEGIWGKLKAIQGNSNLRTGFLNSTKHNINEDSDNESEKEDWEGETHVSRILREYYEKKSRNNKITKNEISNKDNNENGNNNSYLQIPNHNKSNPVSTPSSSPSPIFTRKVSKYQNNRNHRIYDSIESSSSTESLSSPSIKSNPPKSPKLPPKSPKRNTLNTNTYWGRSPNTWGSLSDWDIYFIDQIPGCSKEEAHRSLSIELDILLSNLSKSSRRFTKANALKKALEKCDNDFANNLIWKNHIEKLKSLAISDQINKREIQSIAMREEIGCAEEWILDNKPEKRKKESKIEEESYQIDDKSDTQENLENSEKNKEDIQDNEQTPSVAPSTAKTDVESDHKLLKELLGSNLQCSENMKFICQHHNTLYPDENLIDLQPNSNYFKKLPFKILELYFKVLTTKLRI